MLVIEARTPALGALIEWGPLSAREALVEIARLSARGFLQIAVKDQMSRSTLTIAAVIELANVGTK